MARELPEVTPEVYQHLHRLAERIYRERGFGHVTIQPTVLIHEAWAKITESTSDVASREHFIAIAARAMRQICVDTAKARMREKRGAGAAHTTLSGVGLEGRPLVDLLALDEALTELEQLDSSAAEIVLMRTFGGMTVEEMATVLDTSPRTVNRTWRFARSFLAKQLGP